MQRLARRLKQYFAERPWAALGLVAWSLLVAVQVVSPLWYPTPDSCNYLSMARSIATEGTVTRLGTRNPMYGLGYPVLVSPVFLASEQPFLLLSLVHLGWAGLYVWGTYRWVRRYAPEAALPIDQQERGARRWRGPRHALIL